MKSDVVWFKFKTLKSRELETQLRRVVEK